MQQPFGTDSRKTIIIAINGEINSRVINGLCHQYGRTENVNIVYSLNIFIPFAPHVGTRENIVLKYTRWVN